MPLSIGIIGLPNVGKSTLFNAITKTTVEAENYPFCTIEPNTGMISVPDKRLHILSSISGSQKTLPTTIEFIDIAGLVKGASKGEGLGNKFLSTIREVSALAHIVRCFDDPNITHVNGKIDPLTDIDIINTELILSDYERAEKIKNTLSKKVKSHQKEDIKKLELINKIMTGLASSKNIRDLSLTEKELTLAKEYQFLTIKKVIYVANIDESTLNQETKPTNPYTKQVKEFATKTHNSSIVLCSKLESELAQLPEEEALEYLAEYKLTESGLDQLSRISYTLLGLQTYLTTGEKETRAWTIKTGTKAPQAAGVIHTDFEKGFIKANIIPFDTFVKCNGWKTAKEKGLIQKEGKDYIIKDGDVVEFLFNV